jgi:hypothetical protein
MGKTLYLHVGASKCGSSALQSSLSQTPSLVHPDGRLFQYLCLRENGQILEGDVLKRKAMKSVFQYVASDRFKRLDQGEQLSILIEKSLGKASGGIILSSETWMDSSRYFGKFVMNNLRDTETEVLMFIRPPLDWINSAWWQWGAWWGQSFKEWLSGREQNVNWLAHFESWKHTQGIHKLHLHTTSEDVTKAFSQVTGMPLSKAPRANVTGDAALLRMMQRHPFLRRNAHQSWVEFFYARYAPGPRDPAPWVVPMEFGANLLVRHRENQKRLLDLIDPKVAASIENDPRWWDISAYEGREVAPAERIPLSFGSYTKFSTRTLRAGLNYLSTK